MTRRVVVAAALALFGCGGTDNEAAKEPASKAEPNIASQERAGAAFAREAAKELRTIDKTDRWRVRKVEWGYAGRRDVVVQTGLPAGADGPATGICTTLRNPVTMSQPAELVQVMAVDGSEIEPPACEPPAP